MTLIDAPAQPARPLSSTSLPSPRRGPLAWFAGWVQRAYDKQIDGTGLALFRILYGLVLLGELIQMFYFRHLMFDKIPYLDPAELDSTLPLLFWMGVVVFLTLGLFTRTALWLNYALSVVYCGGIGMYEYHMFYAYTGIGLLLLFLPVERVLSLDRLRVKLKYSSTRFQYQPSRTVSQLAYYTPLLVSVAFVYFGSIFFKTASQLWLRGLGTWKPASLPFVTWANTSWLLNQKWLIISLGYLTFGFELVYLFTFTRKKWRLPLLIIGVGLHLGIAVEFPIPWFALGFAGIYVLMLPVGIWERWRTRRAATAAARPPALTFYYDAECPLCVRTKLTIEHLDTRQRVRFRSVQAGAAQEPALAGIPVDTLYADIHAVTPAGRVVRGIDTYLHVLSAIWYLKPLAWLFRLPGFYHLARRVYRHVATNRTTARCTDETCGYEPPQLPQPDEQVKLLNNLSLRDLKLAGATWGLGFLALLQLICTYESAMIKNVRVRTGFAYTPVDRVISHIARHTIEYGTDLLGITNHPVFMDFHFNEYNHIVAVTYVHPDGHEEFLPIIDEKGQPSWHITGPLWVNWTFRVNYGHINPQRMERGIRDHTAFWAHENGIDLHHARFNIKVKKIDIPEYWEYDFLNRQLTRPWIDAGSVEWRDNQFKPNYREIEKI